MSRGVFFVKLSDCLTSDEQAAYKEFYPRDILLTCILAQNGKRCVVCSWFGRGKQQSLLAALKERFGFTLTVQLAKELEKNGWIL